MGTGEGFLFSSDGASEWLSVMVRISQVFEENCSSKAESAHSFISPFPVEGRGDAGEEHRQVSGAEELRVLLGGEGRRMRGVRGGTSQTCGGPTIPNFYNSYLAAFGLPFIPWKKGQKL